jgi:hypothetical protein
MSPNVLGLGFRAVAEGNLSKDSPGTQYILFYVSNNSSCYKAPETKPVLAGGLFHFF